MNLFKISELLAAGAVSAIAIVTIGTIVTGTYRDAGGATGAERIQQRAVLKAAPVANVSDGFDRGGGSLGIERVAGVNEIKTYGAGQSKTPLVCKRPGLPPHFGG